MTRILVPYLAISLVALPGCGPNRSQWIGQAATRQATTATAPIGNPQEVRRQAGEASAVLGTFAGMFQNHPPKGKERAALAAANDFTSIGSGLQAIADSSTDAGFTNAVFAMCAPQREEAAPRVGRLMVGLAGNIASNPPANMTEQQRNQAMSYFSTFGNRLINIPYQCEQAKSAMTEPSAEEQQAELNHKENVNNAMTAAAVVFAGTVFFASAVGSAAATRPPVVQQYNQQYGPQYNYISR